MVLRSDASVLYFGRPSSGFLAVYFLSVVHVGFPKEKKKKMAIPDSEFMNAVTVHRGGTEVYYGK